MFSENSVHFLEYAHFSVVCIKLYNPQSKSIAFHVE